MFRRIFVFAAVSASLLVAPASGAMAQSNKVIIAQTDSLIYMAAHVAKAKGYFAEEGLDAEIQLFRGGVQALAAVISGDAHVYLGPPSTAMKAIVKGQDIKVFGSVMTQIPTNLVIQGDIAKKRGITASSTMKERMAVLKGLTLGINAPGSAPDQVLRFALRTSSIDPERDVTISPVGAGAALVASFEQRRIDGFAWSSPASDIAIEKFGGVMLVNFAKGEYEPLRGFLYLGLIGRSDWLAQNPERSAAVIRAFWKALRLIHEKPAEAREAMRPFFKDMDEPSFNAGFAANAYAIPTTPRVERRSVELNKTFSEEVEGAKLPVDIDKVFTNAYVDMATRTMAPAGNRPGQ